MRELSLSATDPKILAKQRNKAVVAKCLHKIGIVVPYDEQTDVGYRSLPMTDSRLTQRILGLYYNNYLYKSCYKNSVCHNALSLSPPPPPPPPPSLLLHRGTDEAAQ